MGIEAAARAHVLLLASRGALDDMHALLAALRRRHKALRQMPQVCVGSRVACGRRLLKCRMLSS